MFSLPDLPYPAKALEPHIDEQTMILHHSKHHAAYVKNLNEVLIGYDHLLNIDVNELVKSLHLVPESIRTKVRNNAGGHSNHSMFWELMSPTASQLQGPLLDSINSTFGNLDSFKEKFAAQALGTFGSGWAWLILENGKLEIVSTPNQDSPLMDNKNPILGLDVWEHAYYLKYQNRRAEYISSWWNVINWSEVSKRFISLTT